MQTIYIDSCLIELPVTPLIFKKIDISSEYKDSLYFDPNEYSKTHILPFGW